MLIFLFENGRSKKSEIYAGLPKNSKLAEKLDDLKDLGLVYFEHRSLNNVTFVSLTETGEQVAEKLVEIEDLLLTENRSKFKKY